MTQPKAILPTTLLQNPGLYRLTLLTGAPDVRGIPHHVGHPATRAILDRLGAVFTAGLFTGTQVGECFLVARLRDSRKGGAFTLDQTSISPDEIVWSMVEHLPDAVDQVSV